MSTQTIYNYLSGVTDAASTAAGDDFIILKGGAVQRVDYDKLLPSLDVSALTAATAIADADLLLVRQSTTNKKATAQLALGTYMLGHKAELILSYVSSDTLSLSKGIVEVNGTMVAKTSATTINSGTTNYPSAGAWAFVLIDAAGAVTLQAATGTAAQRPTNNLFQLTGGSVGYDDIGKYGYYYDATHRVIAAFHKVSSTSFYFINMGNLTEEKGVNSLGSWYKTSAGREITQYGTLTQTTNTGGGPYYNSTAQTLPVTMASAISGVASANYPGIGPVATINGLTTSAFTGLVSASTNGLAIPYGWIVKGTF